MRKMCLNESWEPIYDVSLTQVVSPMTPTDSTGFCGKDRPQAGVIVITKEIGEDEDKQPTGRQLLVPRTESYLPS